MNLRSQRHGIPRPVGCGIVPPVSAFPLAYIAPLRLFSEAMDHGTSCALRATMLTRIAGRGMISKGRVLSGSIGSQGADLDQARMGRSPINLCCTNSLELQFTACLSDAALLAFHPALIATCRVRCCRDLRPSEKEANGQACTSTMSR